MKFSRMAVMRRMELSFSRDEIFVFDSFISI
jgi:hypothetical protein